MGEKKHSKDKINVTTDLDWGCTNFTLLGIEFSTNLSLIPERNYTKTLEKNYKAGKDMEQQIFDTSKQITVIKTNLISQCVHLLSSLPRSESFLKTLNTILYKFLWNGKPDKIRRSTTALSHMQGGLKMINVHHFDKALKISWIKKLITQPNSQWYRLMTIMYENISQFLKFGDQWCSKIAQNVHNQF